MPWCQGLAQLMCQQSVWAGGDWDSDTVLADERLCKKAQARAELCRPRQYLQTWLLQLQQPPDLVPYRNNRESVQGNLGIVTGQTKPGWVKVGSATFPLNTGRTPPSPSSAAGSFMHWAFSQRYAPRAGTARIIHQTCFWWPVFIAASLTHQNLGKPWWNRVNFPVNHLLVLQRLRVWAGFVGGNGERLAKPALHNLADIKGLPRL